MYLNIGQWGQVIYFLRTQYIKKCMADKTLEEFYMITLISTEFRPAGTVSVSHLLSLTRSTLVSNISNQEMHLIRRQHAYK